MPPINFLSKSSLSLAIIQTFATPLASAATIEVTSNTDNGDGCTLREAMVSINSQTQLTDCVVTGAFGTNDSITFSNTLNTWPNNTITLSHGQLLFEATGINQNPRVSIDASNLESGITVDADQKSRVFLIRDASLSIDTMTVTRGSSSTGGGGILLSDHSFISLTNSEITGNSTGGDGGGIGGFYGNNIILTDTTVSNNSARNGGGIESDDGSLTLINSTVSANFAANGGGISSTYYGGVRLTNSTVSGNSASQRGGGLFMREFSSGIIENSTISHNFADRGGGAAAFYRAGFTLRNSIIANSYSGGDVYLETGYLGGGFGSDRTSIIEDGSITSVRENGISRPVRRGDPGLLPLSDNGGPTQTHALKSTGIARNTGDETTCTANDQRGQIRASICDVGAFESPITDPDFFAPDFYVIPLSNGKVLVVPL